MEKARIQTAFRFTPELVSRLKRQAQRKHQSLNAYVEDILDRETRVEWPKIPKDYQISEEIKSMVGCIKLKEPSAEDLQKDPKLAYLWEKYGQEA